MDDRTRFVLGELLGRLTAAIHAVHEIESTEAIESAYAASVELEGALMLLSEGRNIDALSGAAHLDRIEAAIAWAERARYDDTTAEQCRLFTLALKHLLEGRRNLVQARQESSC